jgi:hypothetical protein
MKKLLIFLVLSLFLLSACNKDPSPELVRTYNNPAKINYEITDDVNYCQFIAKDIVPEKLIFWLIGDNMWSPADFEWLDGTKPYNVGKSVFVSGGFIGGDPNYYYSSLKNGLPLKYFSPAFVEGIFVDDNFFELELIVSALRETQRLDSSPVTGARTLFMDFEVINVTVTSCRWVKEN